MGNWVVSVGGGGLDSGHEKAVVNYFPPKAPVGLNPFNLRNWLSLDLRLNIKDII